MDWDKLKSFYAVAKYRSISKAASMLYLSQSALSRQIQGLEESLNALLFNRNKKGLDLTEIGKRLYLVVQKTFNELAKIEDFVAQNQEESRGMLRIAAPSGIFLDYLTENCLKEFCLKHPNINLQLINNVGVPANFDKLDVIFLQYLYQPRVITQHKLCDLHLAFFAHRAYLDKHGTPKDINDLKHHKLIAFNPHNSRYFFLNNWTNDLLQESKEDYMIEYNYNCDSTLTNYKLIKNGFGIGILVDKLTHQDKDLVRVLPNMLGPQVSWYVSYHQSKEKIKNIEEFVNFMLEYANKNKWIENDNIFNYDGIDDDTYNLDLIYHKAE